MEDQWGTVVQAPSSSRSRLPRNEQLDLLIMDVLSEKVNYGWVSQPFSDMVIETDILAREPWELPGMDNVSGWYFWKRKTKTEKAKKIDRVIAGHSRWHQYDDKIEIKDNDDTVNKKWGEKRSFTHISCDGTKTGWLMKEYTLDSSRVKVGRDNHIAFCTIIYKKKPAPPF